MPTIRSYSAGQIGVRPDETASAAAVQTGRVAEATFSRIAAGNRQADALGAESASLMGRAVAGLGHAAAETAATVYNTAQEHESRTAISQGAAVYSNLWAQQSKNWNDIATNADPNDATVGPSFLQNSLEPDLQKFVDSMPTEASQKWAEERAASLRQHFFEKTAADTSTRAGAAVVQNLKATQQGLSTGAYNDPASAMFAHDQVDHTFTALLNNPNLTADQQAKIREQLQPEMHSEIAHSEFLGKADVDPQRALAELQAGHYDKYINGTQKAAMVKAGEGIIKEKQTEGRLQEAEVERQKAVASDKAGMDFLNSVQQGPNGTIIVPPGALTKLRDQQQAIGKPGHYMSAMELAERAGKEGSDKLDPAAFQGLSAKLFDPTTPTSPADIIRASASGTISVQQAQQLESNRRLLEDSPLQGPIFKTAMTAAEGQLMAHFPGFNVKDETGLKLQSGFINDFLPRYINATKQPGGPPPNALDLNDPKSLISQSLASYTRTPAQKMSDLAQEFGGLGGLNAPVGAQPGIAPVVPEALKDVKNPHWNPITKQFGDPATGKIYDTTGKEVK